ncbi:MAG: hypothetical protein JST14_04775 [Bacteroidetes bacterium]|nr:hypothetical protein [Bacteroidota bacterium]
MNKNEWKAKPIFAQKNSTMNLIPRILSFSLLGLLVLWKWYAPASTLTEEIFIDALIVLLALGFGELLFTFLVGSASQVISRIRLFFDSIDRTAAWNSLKQLLLAACLLTAGLISPSNGVDEGFRRDPAEMLVETLLIIAACLITYLLVRGRVSYVREHSSNRNHL